MKKPKIEAQEFAYTWQLSKEITEADLAGYGLDQLRDIRWILAKRAATIIGQAMAFDADSEFYKSQCRQLLFNAEREIQDQDGSRIVFQWRVQRGCTPDQARCFFVPGQWFEAEIQKLGNLVRDAAAAAEAFPETESRKIQQQLIM